MPAYDAAEYRPPVPVALVSVHSTKNELAASNVPMLIDTGADVSLLPRHVIAALLLCEKDICSRNEQTTLEELPAIVPGCSAPPLDCKMRFCSEAAGG